MRLQLELYNANLPYNSLRHAYQTARKSFWKHALKAYESLKLHAVQL